MKAYTTHVHEITLILSLFRCFLEKQTYLNKVVILYIRTVRRQFSVFFGIVVRSAVLHFYRTHRQTVLSLLWKINCVV